MPTLWVAISVAVEEYNRLWELEVVVDDVGEIRHGFSALVHRRMQGCTGVVYCIDGILPAECTRKTVTTYPSVVRVEG